MNSFYDGYSGDAFILMVYSLNLSFLHPTPFSRWGGEVCVTIFHAFNILIIR